MKINGFDNSNQKNQKDLKINSLSKDDVLGMSINHESEIPDVVPIISIDNCYFAVKGGLSIVAGTTGSGKSTILRRFMSLALSKDETNISFDPLNFKVTYAGSSFVIYINTEMSDSSVKKKIHDAVLADLNLKITPSNLAVISLVSFTPNERKQYIKHIFQVVPNIHLLIIDGGADTVNSVNDEITTVDAIEELNRLANEYNTTIINVIHENKGNGNTRGHYGQQAERKATGVMSIAYEKTKRSHCIRCIKSRETGHFKDVWFAFDEFGSIYQDSPKPYPPTNESTKSDNVYQLALMAYSKQPVWVEKELHAFLTSYYHQNFAKPDAKIDSCKKTITRYISTMYEKAYLTGDGKGKIRFIIPIDQKDINNSIWTNGQTQLSI